jgi:hypothetical protein
VAGRGEGSSGLRFDNDGADENALALPRRFARHRCSRPRRTRASCLEQRKPPLVLRLPCWYVPETVLIGCLPLPTPRHRVKSCGFALPPRD